MRKVMWYVPLFLSFALLFFYNCSTDRISGGTSTSENGRIAGVIVDVEGVPVSQTEVVLLPAAYNPVRDTETIRTATTDSLGMFLFLKIQAGNYTIQSRHPASGTRAIARNISIHSDTDNITVSDCTLHKPGSIKIAMPNEARNRSGYVYISGTTNVASLVKGEDYVVVDSVPTGIVDTVVFAIFDTGGSTIVRYNADVVVLPEDTATLLTTGWNYARKLLLNTTASGANSNQTLYNFPVLIRLTKKNFDFYQALDDGSDLLFVKHDGTSLPYEIERWNAQNKFAEIWVCIDTLPGDAVSEMTMYWGNAHAPIASDEQNVFTSEAGFLAVWHLDANNDTVYDATTNRYHGIKRGDLTATPGIIGSSLTFGESEAYVEMGDVLNYEEDSFTLSAWIHRADTGLQTIFAKSNGDTPSVSYGWTFSFKANNIVQFFTATNGSNWGDSSAFDFGSLEEMAVADTIQWHYIVVIVDRSHNNKCRIFIDGTNVTGTLRGDITNVGVPLNHVPFRIGAEADGDYQYTGSIDECVIAHTIRSEDWIRLCFINQGSDDRLVEHQK